MKVKGIDRCAVYVPLRHGRCASDDALMITGAHGFRVLTQFIRRQGPLADLLQTVITSAGDQA